MQATFGVHLEEVKKLLDAIRKKIFDNISNCFEIVQVKTKEKEAMSDSCLCDYHVASYSCMYVCLQIDPQILVVTLEIIDMHAAFQKQKADSAKERAEK